MQLKIPLLTLLVDFATVTAKPKKKCPGHFGGKYSKVVNLCEQHFPDAKSEKIWFIKFYAPWCGHCKQMIPAWNEVANSLAKETDIGIGGVDCDDASNKALCGKYGVQGFPTIKAIVGGKAKNYQGAREAGPMKDWILQVRDKRGSKGGSNKCYKGIFKSNVKDSVLPLCAKHYPDEKSKHSWVTAFYNVAEFEKSDEFNRLALECGNEPPEKNKQRKRIIKQSERIKELVSKYSVKGEVLKKAGKSKDPLAKFGAVCCDGEKGKIDGKCEGMTLPHMRVYNHKTKKTYEYEVTADFDMDKFSAWALEKLDYVKLAAEEAPKKKEEKKKEEKKEEKKKEEL